MRFFYKYCLLALMIGLLPCSILNTYSDTEHDFQTWFNLTATGYLNQEIRNFSRFKYWLEGQERLGDDSHRLSQTLGRIGLGYVVTENTSLWLGYAWIHTDEPFTTAPFNENRIWEQLLWSKKYKKFTLLSRTRMEQRFLANGSKTAYRVRQLIKIIKSIESVPNYSFVSSEEIFWHKNNFIGRNGQGFDQNRFFIGLGYRISPILSTEIGYMNQYIRRLGVPNFFNNVLSVSFFMNF